MSSRKRRSLLCYGDSNTHGTVPMTALGDQRRLRSADRWPAHLAQALGAGWQVIAEGQPGRTTCHDDPVEGAHKNGLAVLPAILESHRPLDIVVILLGTNDLKARFGLTAFDIAACAGRLAQAVAASGCGPEGRAPLTVLVAPPPVTETGVLTEMFAGATAKSRGLAGHYAAVAERLGAGFLDAGAHAESDPADGIHLTRDSHRRLGLALARYLAPLTA